jgi:predicted dehydrogenase
MISFFRKFSHKAELRDLHNRVESLTATLRTLQETLAKTPLAPPDAKSVLAPPKPEISNKPKQTGIPLAIVGTRGHGQKHVAAFLKLKGCHIHTICDVDTAVGKAAADKIAAATGHRPKVAQNFDDVLADPAVKAVSISTPHHWHALSTVRALRAGKHVYIEKPVTHSYAEGPVVLSAAAKYKRVVQAGTQLRSNTSLQAAGEYMRSGKLGDITLVHCIVHKDRPPVPLSNTNNIPKSVDYDIWCGPAEMDDVTRSKFHYHWHWLWRLGNGALGNNGIHRIDGARMALDLKGHGDLTLSMGGRYGPKDSGETPNNMLTLHKFGDTWILQDILGLKPKPFHGLENAIVFYGSKGTIVYKTGYAALVDGDFKEIERFEGKQQNHYDDFLKAVAKDDPKAVRGDLAEAILSGDLCHFGNISYRVGKLSNFDDAAHQLRDLKVPEIVSDRLNALKENLDQNGLGPEIMIGDVLYHSDNMANPVGNNPAAINLLSTTYRKGYALPTVADV